MSDKQISTSTLFKRILAGDAAAGELRARFASIIKAGVLKRDDVESRTHVRIKLRKECGLPEANRAKVDGKKHKEDNVFDVTFSRAMNDVFPKAKPGADLAPNGKAKDAKDNAEKGAGPVAKGLTQRMQAYALVLQDLAAAKTQAKLSTTEVKAAEKLLGKLKAIAELAD